MTEPSSLQKLSKIFASAMLLRDLPATYSFHNLEHTQSVVRAARLIGRASQLSDEQLDIALIAAWFHDVGYVEGPYEHEQRSAAVAVRMLTHWGADKHKASAVFRTIIATKMPQCPTDIIGMVLCDADLAHLASKDYETKALKLWQELKTTRDIRLVSERSWLLLNIDFLKEHHYFTHYGKTILDARKKVTVNKLIRQFTISSNTQPFIKSADLFRQ
jgi:predicted metal-dependent HD superfamily phosphohydrolase